MHSFGKVASHFCHPYTARCQPVTEDKVFLKAIKKIQPWYMEQTWKHLATLDR